MRMRPRRLRWVPVKSLLYFGALLMRWGWIKTGIVQRRGFLLLLRCCCSVAEQRIVNAWEDAAEEGESKWRNRKRSWWSEGNFCTFSLSSSEWYRRWIGNNLLSPLLFFFVAVHFRILSSPSTWTLVRLVSCRRFVQVWPLPPPPLEFLFNISCYMHKEQEHQAMNCNNFWEFPLTLQFIKK